MKSHFPKAHLTFVKEEMQSVEDNLRIAELAVTENDRVTATATIQNMTEALLDIEAILMGESTVEMDYEEYSDEDNDYEDDYDEMEEEIYMRHEKEKYRAAAKTNGKKKEKVRIEEATH